MDFKILNFVVLLLQIQFLVGQVLVQLPNGKIKGREATTFENKTFYAFEGIPYAAPPVGNLRFKPPQATSDWESTLDATRSSRICHQTDYNEDRESEDCLHINVYTPQLPDDNKNTSSLPVMFYIHGGGFLNGNGQFSPDLIVNQDVILVTINYRLGVFGFISTQDKVIPGNNGLKDQRFAIQWVHDNIGLFGGDPDRVTIFGESAGSASCAYQLLNLNSKGLFQGAILQSGSFLSPWTYQRRARQIAFGTAALLNSTFNTSEDSQALLDYLLAVDARTLDNAAQQYRSANLGQHNVEISQGFFWAPIVEVDNPDAFLTEKMYGLLEKGDVIEVPIMIGVTSEESLLFNPDPNNFKDLLQTYDQRLELLVPDDMGISDDKDRTEMGRKIRDLYTEGKPLAENLGDGMRYCSDTSFTRSVIKHAEIHSVLAPTYFYILSFDGAIPNFNVHYEGAEKVAHTEDLAYLICSGTACDDSGFPEADRKTRRRMVKMWTDFAKYKNPTPESSDLLQNVTWPCVQIYDGDFLYLDIDENLTIKNHPKEATYEGWEQLYDSLGHDDFDTY